MENSEVVVVCDGHALQRINPYEPNGQAMQLKWETRLNIIGIDVEASLMLCR